MLGMTYQRDRSTSVCRWMGDIKQHAKSYEESMVESDLLCSTLETVSFFFDRGLFSLVSFPEQKSLSMSYAVPWDSLYDG